MKYRTRTFYTDSQKALMWDRWREGESLEKIAQLFGRPHTSVGNILARSGGIRPARRCRSQLALTITEREEISRGVIAGRSVRSIALDIARSPSTVSREINRNGARNATERPELIMLPGIGHAAQRSASWPRIEVSQA